MLRPSGPSVACSLHPCSGFFHALLRCGRKRRHPSVRRIDDQRSPPIRDQVVSTIAPEFVVGPVDVHLRSAVAAIAAHLLQRSLHVIGGFLFGEECLTGEFGRAAPAASAWSWSRRPADRAGRRRCAVDSSSWAPTPRLSMKAAWPQLAGPDLRDKTGRITRRYTTTRIENLRSS